jgi:hypothetical protein
MKDFDTFQVLLTKKRVKVIKGEEVSRYIIRPLEG